MKLKIIKGTRDIYGQDVRQFQFLEEKAAKVFSLYGYEEIRTPIFERTDLFAHGVGADTDIVGKEMYLFEDRRGTSLALRPEGTAPVVRSVITNNSMKQVSHLRYYYLGPMFRYEQPQKGRFRQFYQIGAEYYGVPTPDADLEMFLLLRQYFKEISLKSISFQINTIGCQAPDCRPEYKKRLIEFLTDRSAELCETCNHRIQTNPLRVLDCKNEQCARVTQSAPKIYESVCPSCADHFDELKSLLSAHNLDYELNARLVRGLDYYSQTVFEVYSDNLGAQNAAGGGGRYDGLFEIYGQKQVPSLGFALGLDRLAMLTKPPEPKALDVFVIGTDRKELSLIAARCREAGFSCQYDPQLSSFKSQFRQANRLDSRKVLILGEEELANNQVSIKDMRTSEQATVDVATALKMIAET